jgi:hypothetical protein
VKHIYFIIASHLRIPTSLTILSCHGETGMKIRSALGSAGPNSSTKTVGPEGSDGSGNPGEELVHWQSCAQAFAQDEQLGS